jgi:hypothetical protein
MDHRQHGVCGGGGSAATSVARTAVWFQSDTTSAGTDAQTKTCAAQVAAVKVRSMFMESSSSQN